VKRWKPDLIHAHFAMAGFNALELRRKVGVPLVTSFYGRDAWQLPTEHPEWIPRYRQLFREGTLFLVEGPAMRERMQILGCPLKKLHICRMGVRLDEIPFMPKPITGPLKIVMMARFTPRKGLEDGLAACVQAIHRGVDALVTLIGGPSPGDPTGEAIAETLRALAKGPETEGRIDFVGFVQPDRAREILRQHHVFLCPSKHAPNGDAEGGSPVALTEAMALGLLCVATRHCDIPEVARHEDTGLLADSGDVTGLTDLLERVAKFPSQVERLRTAGRKHVEENFPIGNQLRDLRAVYDACLATDGRRMAKP
jgi:colanic acid/amylovoran biosynthesis glycosyltransferase